MYMCAKPLVKHGCCIVLHVLLSGVSPRLHMTFGEGIGVFTLALFQKREVYFLETPMHGWLCMCANVMS